MKKATRYGKKMLVAALVGLSALTPLTTASAAVRMGRFNQTVVETTAPVSAYTTLVYSEKGKDYTDVSRGGLRSYVRNLGKGKHYVVTSSRDEYNEILQILDDANCKVKKIKKDGVIPEENLNFMMKNLGTEKIWAVEFKEKKEHRKIGAGEIIGGLTAIGGLIAIFGK